MVFKNAKIRSISPYWVAEIDNSNDLMADQTHPQNAGEIDHSSGYKKNVKEYR